MKTSRKIGIFLLLILVASACKKTAETEGAPEAETYVSIINLAVQQRGTSQTESPNVTWQLGFPVFSYLEGGIATSATAEPDVAPWTNIGVGTSHIFTDLTLALCTPYYPMVRAKSSTGQVLDTHVVSAPFVVDPAAPTTPSSLIVTENGDDTKSSTVSWTAATDNCAVAGYRYAIGSAPGGTDIVNWSPVVGVSYQVTAGAAFVYGDEYYTSVKAVDTAGQESAVATTSAWRLRAPSAKLTGTQTMTSNDFNATATTSMRWSSAVLNSDYFSHNTVGNPDELVVKRSGDYLISLSMPFNLLSGCATRCSIRATVLVNGVAREDAFANSSYVANGTGFNESSNFMSAYLQNLSANDVIKVYIEKGTANVGTMVSEAVQAYVEYVIADREFFYATATRSAASTNLNGAVASSMEWAQQASRFSYTHSSSTPTDITLNSNGNYLVRVNIPYQGTGACANRSNVKIQMYLNGALYSGGQANQGGIDCQAGHVTGSAHWIGMVSATAGQVLNVRVIQEASAVSNVEVETGKLASIVIERMKDFDSYISLAGTRTVASTNWNLAFSPVQWSVAIATDPAAYTHSTGVNNHQITVNRTGTYLALFNNHTTSATVRANLTIRVQKNGANVTGAACLSGIITNTDSNNEGSCALGFAMDITAGDVITVISGQEAAAGTVNSASPALFTLLRVK